MDGVGQDDTEIAHHKPFMVNFPAMCMNEFSPDNTDDWSEIVTDPRPIKALVLGCRDGAQESEAKTL